uniref:Uncharacterized protein n=1 Tax=Chromera velia CCMP2878 TaxID=1169474 RepID=A0A0G4I1G0_9ALVE|eukprot:Cvel_10151.t1-p1 / transcript=Cvel_10151.t1 / gene=Cvel_10151 / organism=Chromera_velia_CCMP2878 / gene_product=hypothetical protein / transcript_product=hypothetical protein / location=Cvel_scaffold605:51662-56474(+) / protein_length=924 / sequence_SO=supercontig / SO=protein_coding / is_pseudo=false
MSGKNENISEVPLFNEEDGEGGKGDVISSGHQETEREREREEQANRNDALCLFLQRLRLTSQTLSLLAKKRDSFGLAWLSACLFTKIQTLGKVTIQAPHGIDVSGIRGLSSKKVLLLLDFLPSSVVELKLDSLLLKGAAFPLLIQHLERRMEAPKGEGGSTKRYPPLRAVTFAENSMGSEPPEGAFRKIFPLLLYSLESLCLKGNAVGLEGIRTFAEEIRAGRAASLKSLDLEKTGLVKERLETFCEALKEKPLAVLETLNLSGNDFEDFEVKALCSVLSPSCLPCLRTLWLRFCGLDNPGIERIAQVLGDGQLPRLETLDLEGTGCEIPTYLRGSFLSPLSKTLRVSCVPCLKNLNLMRGRGVENEEAVTAFLAALQSGECPSLECVQLHLKAVRQEDLEALAAGRIPAVRVLGLDLDLARLKAFVREVRYASEGPKFDTLDLRAAFSFFDVNWGASTDGDVEDVAERESHWLKMLGEAIDMGRLTSLRKFELRVHSQSEMDFSSDEIAEGKSALLSAFSRVRLPLLCELSMRGVDLSDDHMNLLSGAFRNGNLPVLRVFDLSANRNVGQDGMEFLMGSVFENDKGLPHLEKLELGETNGGGGVGSVGAALGAGKLERLSNIQLRHCGLTDESVRGLADALRGGWLCGMVLLNLSENRGVSREAWEYFMTAIAESEEGMRELRRLNLLDTNVETVGGGVATALGSGKVPSLQSIFPSYFHLDERGVRSLCDAIREGKFPSKLGGIGFRLLCEDGPPIDLDPLLVSIAESEGGLPSCVTSLNLSGGRVGVGSLALLAASRGDSLRGKLSSLESLSLSGCQIDDARLQRLAEVFRAHECGALGGLGLHQNCISAAGLSTFLDTLQPESLPNVYCLGLEGQRVQGGEGGQEQEESLDCFLRTLLKEPSRTRKLPSVTLIGSDIIWK